MGVLQEIFDWSKSLPDWQSDAIARLFAKQSLSPEDIEELLALLKAEHGIPDSKNREAVRLREDQIPAQVKDDTRIEIIAMRDLENVNAIAANEKINFAPTGLTVIYGDNGSGKSGYVRVLKRACRARDQSEQILPNANLQPHETGTARAVFDMSIADEKKEEIWIDGETSPEILSTIAIFDQRCARAYLDKEDDFAFIPYGLDILEDLAEVCRKLGQRLTSEQLQCSVDVAAFADLHGSTEVGNLIENLSSRTTSQQVEALANMTGKEVSRHKELSKSLKDDDPKQKAQQLRLKANRIKKIAQRALEIEPYIDDNAKTKLLELDSANQAAQVATKLAAEKFSEGSDYLPGTGGEAWRMLFEAARSFSNEAYPGKIFPNVEKGAVCPLCQQSLDQGVDHLLHFEEFIQQETERKALLKREELVKATRAFNGLDLSLGFDTETFSETVTLDKQLAEDTNEFEQVISQRQTQFKAALSSHNWNDITSLKDNPGKLLFALSDKLNDEAVTFEKAADHELRMTLEKEFNELDARSKLEKQQKNVIIAIEKLSLKAKLTRCLSAVKTDAISRKARELTEKTISKELEKALNEEFKELGVGDLQVSLQSRIQKGRPLHKLKLNLPQANKISDILSEGEKHSIAIGSFLAEVNVKGGSGGIVFDDPVSSLDHLRRERLAKRLSKEAKKRQVVVFTHELFFLANLLAEAEKAGIDIIAQTLNRKPTGCGSVPADLPFKGRNTKSRIGYLRELHQDIAKAHRDGDIPKYQEMTKSAYGFLRDTWEGAVEEVLLRQVVMRFRKGVETSRLREVNVEDSDYSRVEQGYTKCSNYCHDSSLIANMAIPEPDELLEDINDLEKYRGELEERSKRVSKERR